MTDTATKEKKAPPKTSASARKPAARVRAPRDPFAAEKKAYIAEMLNAGFSLADATTIAEKTNYKSRTRMAERQAAQPAALGDFFAGLTPPPVDRPKTLPVPKTAVAKPARQSNVKPIKAVYNYCYDELPAQVKDLIEAYLLIEQQDAKATGSIGFFARALAIATLPHKRVDDFRFVRRNGDYTFTMMTAHPQGLPSGTLPRILLSWVCTEAVRTKEPVLCIGSSLAETLRELGLKNTGGEKGDITRLKRAMTTLFSAVISCHYSGKTEFDLQNVLLADRVQWWEPQDQAHAGHWESKLSLSAPFFKECVEHPIPVNLIALKALSTSSLAMDIYVWLTHRMSYLSTTTRIPWISLQAQFGANYALNEQGLRDFRRAFLRELKKVVTVYQTARLATDDKSNCLILYPSPPHIAPNTERRSAQQVLPLF